MLRILSRVEEHQEWSKLKQQLSLRIRLCGHSRSIGAFDMKVRIRLFRDLSIRKEIPKTI